MPGLVFSSGIELGDLERKITLAWLIPTKPGDGAALRTAGLYRFDQAGAAVGPALLSLPAGLPSGEDCSYESQLQQTGKSTVSSRLSVHCQQRSLTQTPTQSITVLDPWAAQPQVLQFLLAEPAPGENLKVEVHSDDVDEDGRDDVELMVTLTAPSGAQESLPVRWLNRPAGASRQANTPLDALTRRVAALSTQAVQKAHRARVPDQVDALRRLLASLCGDLGTARLVVAPTSELQCGKIWPQLAQLVHVAAQAHLGNKQVARAIGEASRFDWFAHKPSDAERKALHKLILPHVKQLPVKQLARFDVKLNQAPAPAASPLHFDSSGQLWGRFLDAKVRRLTLSGDPPLVPQDQTPAVVAPSWEQQPQGPGGRFVSAVVASCERSEVQLALGRADGVAPPPVAIGLLAPRPGNCREFSGINVRGEILGWQAGQVEVLIGGEAFWSGGPHHDPDQAIAFGSTLGIIVQDAQRLQVLEVEEGVSHHDCVVNTGRDKLACVRGDSVFVFGLSGVQ
ncbi:MAG TPA: hypothetical protein VN764_12680 [Polyangiaceae bacterium]|nr:hypothetical protein [Polyangiaceae bacterium]